VSSSRLLTIRTEDRAGEVTLFDHDYEVVATGVAALEAEVQPGMFKLRVATGEHVRESYLLVDETQVRALDEPSASRRSPRALPTVENSAAGALVRVPPARPPSPVPLSSTSRWREYHTAAAERIAAAPPVQRGAGARLFVFARRWSPGGSSGHAGHPAQGLTLHAADGDLLFDFEKQAEVDLNRDPYSGARIELDPGFYRLRLAKDGRSLEQGLIVRPPWEVEVFLMATQRGARTEPQELDLSRASVLLSPSPFQSNDAGLRLAELARQGLTTRRQVIDPQDLEEMLHQKFDNPMLGIFAAHLLLLEPEVKRPLLRVVVKNLAGLLGIDHPDVVALEFAASGMPPFFGAFRFPPMLAASWDLALRASASSPAVIPPNSFAARIAARRWNSFPWLSWDPPEPEIGLERMVFSTSLDEGPLNEDEARLLRLLSHEQGVRAFAREGEFDDARFDEDASDDYVSIDRLVRKTRLPAAVIVDSARSLLERAQLPERSHRHWSRVESALHALAGGVAKPVVASDPSGETETT